MASNKNDILEEKMENSNSLFTLFGVRNISEAQAKAEREALGLNPERGVVSSFFSWIFEKIRVWVIFVFCPCMSRGQQGVSGLFSFKRSTCRSMNPYFKFISSFIAFLFGWIFAFAVALVAIYIGDLDPWMVFFYAGALGFMLGLLLWCYVIVRLYLIILIIKLFTDKFIWFVILYTFYLVIVGPCNNIKVAEKTKIFGDKAANPLNEAYKALEASMEHLEELSGGMMQSVAAMQDMVDFHRNFIKRVAYICSSFKNFCSWLCDMLYSKCRVFMQAPFRQCRKHAHWVISWFCPFFFSLQNFCSIFHAGKYILCNVPWLFNHLFKTFEDIAKTAMASLMMLREEVALEVKVHWKSSFITTQNAYLSEGLSKIFDEAFYELSSFLNRWFWLFEFLVPTMILFIVADAAHDVINYYLYDHYENFIINNVVQEIDQRRQKRNRPTILPLKRQESKLYIISGSDLTEKERDERFWKLLVTTAFLLITIFIFLIDHYVYNTVKYFQENLIVIKVFSQILSMKIKGKGALSEIMEGLVDAFADVKNEDPHLNECVHMISEVDYKGMLQIGLLFLYCYFSIFFKHKMMRFKIRLCDYFFPKRRLHRGMWLYNHILRARIPLMKMTFDRRRDMLGRRIRQPNLIDKLASRFTLVEDCLSCMAYESVFCVMCGVDGGPYDQGFTKCDNFSCTGVYCLECFEESNHLCVLCYKLISYDDEEISEEIDSSDEDVAKDKRLLVKLSSKTH